MAVQRDLQAEQRAVGAYRAANQGKLPDLNNPAQRAQVYKLAYPPTAGGLPQELQGTVDESLYAGGASSPKPATPLSKIDQLGQNLEGARGAITEGGQYTQTNVNEFGRVLQDSIRRAAGYTEPNVQLGESNLFKQAGVTGYNALSQSLAAHSSQMVNSAASLERLVSDLSGSYKAKAEDALNAYNIAAKEYEAEASRIQKLAEMQAEFQQQIYLNNQEQELKIQQWALDNGLSYEEAKNMMNGVKDYSNVSLDDFANALRGQESGGNYNALNQRTGASGAFQILPGNWPKWSQEYADATGLNMSLPNTPENQDKVAKFKMQQYFDKYGNWEDVASMWYSGRPLSQVRAEGWADNKQGPYPPGDKRNTEPSVNEYVRSVMSKIKTSDTPSDTMNRAAITSMVATLYPGVGVKVQGELVNGLLKEMKSTGESIPELRARVESQLIGGVDTDKQTYLDAAKNVTKNIKNEANKQSQINIVLDYINKGDAYSAKDQLKSMARENMDVETRKQVISWENMIDFANTIKNDLAEYEKGGGDKKIFTETSLINGTTEDAYRVVGKVKDERLRTIAAKIAMNLQQYRRAMTGVAFGDNESVEYAKLFPSIKYEKELNNSLINAMLQDFPVKINSAYKREIGSTQYDKIFGGSAPKGESTKADAKTLDLRKKYNYGLEE